MPEGHFAGNRRSLRNFLAIGGVHGRTGFEHTLFGGRSAFNHLGPGIAKRTPEVGEFSALRAGVTGSRSFGEGGHQRVGGFDVRADRHVTGLVGVDLRGFFAGQEHGQLHRAVNVLAVRVDVEAINTVERVGLATRASGDRHNTELVTEVFLVVSQSPRAIDEHGHGALTEGGFGLAIIGFDDGASGLQVEDVLHRIGPTTLISNTLVVAIEQLATERAGEAEHVIGTQEQVQALAILDGLQEFFGRLGGIGQQFLVVVEGNGLGRFGHAVDLAIHLHAFDRNVGEGTQATLQVGVEGQDEPAARPVAEVIIRGNEHIGAATSSNFGLILVEDFAEGDLQHVDLQVRVSLLGIGDQFG